MNKIIALVVTYNRKELLKENIEALLKQSYSEFDILVVDNASTDGTKELIETYKDRVIYENTGANLGGAGGFHFGLKKAVELGYQYCWLMDDDTIPKENSLEILKEKADKLKDEFSYLCSYVEWTDGKPCKMNQVIPNKLWYEEADKLNSERLLKLKSCTFVSVFINLEVTKKVGLPVKQMFIYGDDHEYTTRLSKEKPGYFVIDSVVVHKMGTNKGYQIEDIPKERISRYYYDSRNRLYRAKKEGFREIVGYFYWLFTSFGKILFKSQDKKLYRIRVILKGFIVGIFFNPKIEYVEKK
jgi:GT2 family glycosyltransferase